MDQNSSRDDKPAPGPKDLEYAAELRAEIHEAVLEKVHQTDPAIDAVADPYTVNDYFQYSWEYPGQWYLVVAIPEGFRGRRAFIDFLVRETMKRR